MFFNDKTLEVKVVKDKNIWKGPPEEEPQYVKPVDHYALATVTAERAVQSGVLLLGVYFAATTLREVAIHTAKVKIK